MNMLMGHRIQDILYSVMPAPQPFDGGSREYRDARGRHCLFSRLCFNKCVNGASLALSILVSVVPALASASASSPTA